MAFRFILIISLSVLLIVSCDQDTKDFNNLREITYNGENIINEEIWIKADEKVIIEAGTKITFGPNGSFQIEGEFEAIANVDQPIILVGNDALAAHTIIHTYDNNSVNLLMEHVQINNGLIFSESENNRFIEVHINNNKMLESDDAMIRTWRGSFLFENGSIKGNNTGEGLLVHSSKEPIVRNSVFDSIPDAVEFIESSDGEIANCFFYYMADDGVDNNNCQRTKIINNEFYGITDRAIEIGSDGFGLSEEIHIENNLFVDCHIGINIKESSTASVSQATFYHTRLNIELLNGNSNNFPTSLNLFNSVMSGEHAWISNNENCIFTFTNLMSDQAIEGMEEVLVTEIEFRDPDFFDFEIVSSEFPLSQNSSNMGYQK